LVSPTVYQRRWLKLLAEVKALRVSPAVVRILDAAGDADGFGSRSGDGSGGGGRSVSSPVERLAFTGETRPWRELAELDRLLADLEVTVGRFRRLVERNQPPVTEQVVLCTVGAYHDEWALPLPGEVFPCPELAECHPDTGRPRHELLCVKHRARKRRAERAAEVEGGS